MTVNIQTYPVLKDTLELLTCLFIILPLSHEANFSQWWMSVNSLALTLASFWNGFYQLIFKSGGPEVKEPLNQASPVATQQHLLETELWWIKLYYFIFYFKNGKKIFEDWASLSNHKERYTVPERIAVQFKYGFAYQQMLKASFFSGTFLGGLHYATTQ